MIPQIYQCQNNIVGNNLLNEINNSNKQNPQDLVNICKGVKSSIEANFFVLKLNFEELKNKVQPTIWRNSEFCIYRMDPIMSTNNQLNNTAASENDYYYSLGDVILFKNYNKFFNKPKIFVKSSWIREILKTIIRLIPPHT